MIVEGHKIEMLAIFFQKRSATPPPPHSPLPLLPLEGKERGCGVGTGGGLYVPALKYLKMDELIELMH